MEASRRRGRQKRVLKLLKMYRIEGEFEKNGLGLNIEKRGIIRKAKISSSSKPFFPLFRRLINKKEEQ